MSEVADKSARLQEANDLLTGAAKWLVAALGAIGAVLVAGSQLSSLGSLQFGPRFLTAVLGLVVGLAGVTLAILLVLSVLTPHRYTPSELAREWTASGARRDVGVSGGWWKQRKYPVPHWFGLNPEHLANHESPVQLLDHFKDRQAPDRDKVLNSLNEMTRLANYVRHEAKYARMRVPLVLAMTMAALGISVFAWAANPPEKAPSTLRNTNLSGADLSGSSLAGADLTGADLSGVDLRGAILRGAIVKDVKWSNTTCPDGTNSDDSADASGKGSCEGHLTP